MLSLAHTDRSNRKTVNCQDSKSATYTTVNKIQTTLTSEITMNYDNDTDNNELNNVIFVMTGILT